ncbi:hypothetical protein ABWU02_020005 [Proteus mirabilis]
MRLPGCTSIGSSFCTFGAGADELTTTGSLSVFCCWRSRSSSTEGGSLLGRSALSARRASLRV